MSIHEAPKEIGYHWFDGFIYREGALGGTIDTRGLVEVTSIDPILVSYDGMVYTECDISGQYTGPLLPPPWDVIIKMRP